MPETFTLRSGASLPAIGIGTFTGTRLTQRAARTGPGGTMEENVERWLRLGGRGMDCGQNYLNEAEIGDAIHKCINEGIVTRDELFVSSKLNNPYHRPEHVREALMKTLLDLRLDTLDLFLIHWPTAFEYVPFASDERYNDGRGLAQSYEPDQCSKQTGQLWSGPDGSHWDKTGKMPPHLAKGVTIHDTWRAMVELQKEGLVKDIGVCNMNVQLLYELCAGNPDHLPSVLQVESHPYCQQPLLLKFCKHMGIQLQAYSPLGYGEFRGAQEIWPLKDETLARIAKKHGASTAQVCLRWTNQRGVATNPFTLKENEMKENLDIHGFTLDDEDMATIASLDKGYHYLRPQDWYGLPYWS